jgi:hypothetical protein
MPVEAPANAAGYSMPRVIEAFKRVAQAHGYTSCQVRDYTCEDSEQYVVLFDGGLRRAA